MEDEDWLKRHTDCVHFMATPPTCDKGHDCEFRHNKVARLNPKVCWYWLAGECFNPTCAFKHPPLEGYEAAPTESDSAPLSMSANNTGVPCYFYLNGMCNKGDRCSFLHDIVGSGLNGECSKGASACTEALPPEKKVSVVNETLSAPTPTPKMTHRNPSETTPKAKAETGYKAKQDPIYFNHPQESASPTSYSSDEDADADADDVQANTLLPAEGTNLSKSIPSTDQSSEEGVDDLIMQEEYWESSPGSPGFDVLVDGKSENLGFEDSPEYFPTLDGERRELNSQSFGYDFEHPNEYDPLHPELIYHSQSYGSYDCLDTSYIFGMERRIPDYEEDEMMDSIISHKRKFMPMELTDDDLDDLDLRNHLRRRRLVHDCSITGLSRMHDSVQFTDRSQGRAHRHHTGWHGRLASEKGNNTYESIRKNGAFSNARTHRHSNRPIRQHRSRKHQERMPAKPQFLSSGSSRKPVQREKRSTQESTTFTGPKSLAQIKEEKMKAVEDGGGIRKSRHAQRTQDDFQGPKPLTEILKEKRKPTDRREGHSGSY